MSQAHALAAALVALAEANQLILEAVDGHRAELLRRGYSPTAAEAMAMDLHRGLMATAFRTPSPAE